MDLISLLLQLATQNPAILNNGIAAATQPGQVQAAQLHDSLADFAQQTLTCYHRTARYVDAEVLGGPWDQQHKYGAASSVVVRISFAGGFTGTPYEMTVAAMAKPGAYRAAVLHDTAMVPPNKDCQLTRWVAINP